MNIKEIGALVKGTTTPETKNKIEVVNKKSSILYTLEDKTRVEVNLTSPLPEEGPYKLTLVLNQIYKATANLKCWAAGSEKITSFISTEYMGYLLPRIAYLVDCLISEDYGDIDLSTLPKEIKDALISRGLLFFINQYKTDSLLYINLYPEEAKVLIESNKDLIEKLMTIIY
jgi:hypothetical protein